MGILIRALDMPESCSKCFGKTYDNGREWIDKDKQYRGAYICQFTGNIIKSFEREEMCPLEEKK